MRRRALRTLAQGARSAALLGTFVGALTLGVKLHANTTAFRRAAATIGNSAMSGLFEGTIVVRNVQALSIGETGKVRAAEVEVTDPDGKRVVLVHDVEAAIDLRRLVGSLVRGGPLDVEIPTATIGNADVTLNRDASGAPTIARTFKRPKRDATSGTATAKPSTEPTVRIAAISIGHAHVHGNLVPPELDGDADAVVARVTVAHNVVVVTLARGRVTLRSPKVPPSQTMPLVGDANGTLEVDIATTQLTGRAELTGSCGDIPLVARAQIDKENVEATVDIARTPAAAVVAVFPSLPIREPLEIHARAHGALPVVAIEAKARLGETAVDASGEIDLRENLPFKLDFTAEHVDARAFGADVATDVSGKVHAEGLVTKAGPVASFRVETTPGAVAGERIPAALLQGHFEERQLTATVRASEPGVEASGKIVLDVPTKIATFDAQARSGSLRALARAPNLVDGAASVRVQGSIDLASNTISATTNASGDRIAIDAFSAQHLTASGTLTGPLPAPILDVSFVGKSLQVKVADKEPLVYPNATGRAKVAFAPTPRIFDASVTIAQVGSAETVTASAEAIHFAKGGVVARGLRVTGLGAPLELEVHLGDVWSLRAKTANLELRRAAGITGIKELTLLPEDTRASIDIDVRQGHSGAEGHFDIVVKNDKLGPATLVAEAHGSIDRGTLTGTAKIDAVGFGNIEITHAELELPRRIDARSLSRTTGVMELRGAVDLAQGAALFAGESVERVEGIASFEARIERRDPDALPAMRGTVRTRGLEVAISGSSASDSVTIAGVELLTHVAWDGRTEDAELAIVSWDARGVLLTAGAKSRLPLTAWATGSKRFEVGALAALDIDGVVDIPRRDVDALPAFLGAPALGGKVESHVRVTGSVGHPALAWSARLFSLVTQEERRRRTALSPLDATIEARWDGERATATFSVDERPAPRERPARRVSASTESSRPTRPKKTPGHLRGLVLGDVRVSDLLRLRPLKELPWSASAEIEIANLTLQALPLPTRVNGVLSGRVRIKDLNRDPSIEASAHIDGFGTGGGRGVRTGTQVEHLDVTLGGRDASLFANATIADKETKATLQVASKALRMRGVSVSWEPLAPTRIDYVVQNGRLELVAPFVAGTLSELEGRVDGAGSASIDEASQVFEGGLAVQNARVYVDALGEEIASLNAIARFERSGTFRIDGATGKMGSGEFRASASGRMKGTQFMGAQATVVATKDGVPISIQGATFAEATGEVKITAKMSDDRGALIVTMDVPRADVQLPDRSTQSLQVLEPDPTIGIGVRRGGSFDTKAIRLQRGGTGTQGSAADTGALVTRMTVTLGKEVRLEGRGIDVMLGGQTLIELGEELKLSGSIDLRDGTVEVQGRRFTIERGTVTFSESGDPANPTVVAAAYWDSPDRTRVWVEFAGPLRTGTLTLRSEPPYTKSEILSVLIFGRPDPNQSTTGEKTGDASGATAVGSGLIASDLNHMLSAIDENLDIETDSLSGNRTRTKLGRSFFDRRLKVQLGVAPGRTYREPDTAYLFLNWQFVPKWSLILTRGDRGTSILDVLFQHRY